MTNQAILDTAGVIHDYMRNGDKSTSREECITWIAQLIQETQQQTPSKMTLYPFVNPSVDVPPEAFQQAPSANTLSRLQRITGLKFATEDEHFKFIEENLMHLNPTPSAEDIPQPTEEERKHFAEHNNSRIIKYTETPSATVDEIEAYPTNLTKDEWSGATAIQCIQSLKFSKYQTPDGLHNLENNIAFHRLAELAGMNHENTIYTVDVMKSKDGQVFPVEEAFQIIRAINEVKSVNVTALDYIAQLHSQQATVDVDALWDKHSVERNEMNYEGFKKAISELSQKRYTEQQMKDFAFEYHIGTYIRDVDKALSQFDSEGNDGKV